MKEGNKGREEGRNEMKENEEVKEWTRGRK